MSIDEELDRMARLKECFKNMISENVGKGKRYETTEDCAADYFRLYWELIDKHNEEIEKYKQFKSLINQASTSFHMLDFSNMTFDGRWIGKGENKKGKR